MNIRKLKGKVFEKYATQGECAEKLGISRAYLNEIVNGRRKIDLEMATSLVNVLELNEQEALDIFFPSLVAKSKQ
jgi:plasmid maintenance system antidote protein VapI